MTNTEKIKKIKEMIKKNDMIGKTYTVVEILQIFGYSTKTNLIDTVLYRLVEAEGPYTSKTCKCRIKPESEWIITRGLNRLI